MSRFASHRFSRFLMAILGATMIVGGIVCARTLWPAQSASAKQEPKPEPRPAVAIAPATKPAAVEPLITSTPPLPSALPSGEGSVPTGRVAGEGARGVVVAPATRPAQESGATAAVPAAATITPGSAAKTLADGKAMIESGDLLAGRKLLNDALIAGSFTTATDTTAAKSLISEANKTLICSAKKFSADPFATTHTVQKGEMLKKIAFNYDVTWEFLGRINGLSDPRRMRAGQSLKVIQGPFHAVVSKKDYTLDIYLGSPGKSGSLYITTYRVGLGKDNSTPVGTWMVETDRKIRNPVYYSPRGEGVIEADDPKNPLGEYWIGLVGTDGGAVGKTSYGIHGTIEPDSIGKQASMGCIRLLNDDVAVVFDLLVEGKSTVEIRE